MKITHLIHSDIDKKYWDKKLSQCQNATIYAQSWWLDIVAPGWEALVSEDFSYIMPLPRKSKWGLPVFLQPAYTQQLGLFSDQIIPESVISLFLGYLPSGYYNLHWNNSNSYRKWKKKNNYILHLDSCYEDLNQRFSKNTKRNIQYASKQSLNIKEIEPKKFLDEFTKITPHYEPRFFPILNNLITACLSHHTGAIWGCEKNGKLITAVFIPRYLDTNYYLAPFSSTEGKESKAMFLLLDEFIKKNAGSTQKLDFEGSSIEGVARMYKGFGAINTPYFTQQSFSIKGHSIPLCIKK
ncbi:MAG: hypothetical protein PUB21_12555 [Bacteroidales bacterium]|nr:hypothetical protein [Bacteroidales bacterium]